MAQPPRTPSFDSPGPIILPPKITKAPVTDGAPESPSGVHRIMDVVASDIASMKRKARYKTYGILGTLMLSAFGGKVAWSKGETAETKHARLEEKHQALEVTVENLSKRVDAGEAAQQKTAQHVERLEGMLEMELRLHGVPESKIPPKVQDAKP